MTYEEAVKKISEMFSFAEERGSYYGENAIPAYKMALQALERQIPKKPENHSGRYYDNLCPLCGKRIKSGQGSSSRQRTNWCNHCGQAIDWSDIK